MYVEKMGKLHLWDGSRMKHLPWCCPSVSRVHYTLNLKLRRRITLITCMEQKVLHVFAGYPLRRALSTHREYKVEPPAVCCWLPSHKSDGHRLQSSAASIKYRDTTRQQDIPFTPQHEHEIYVRRRQVNKYYNSRLIKVY